MSAEALEDIVRDPDALSSVELAEMKYVGLQSSANMLHRDVFYGIVQLAVRAEHDPQWVYDLIVDIVSMDETQIPVEKQEDLVHEFVELYNRHCTKPERRIL